MGSTAAELLCYVEDVRRALELEGVPLDRIRVAVSEREADELYWNYVSYQPRPRSPHPEFATLVGVRLSIEGPPSAAELDRIKWGAERSSAGAAR